MFLRAGSRWINPAAVSYLRPYSRKATTGDNEEAVEVQMACGTNFCVVGAEAAALKRQVEEMAEGPRWVPSEVPVADMCSSVGDQDEGE